MKKYLLSLFLLLVSCASSTTTDTMVKTPVAPVVKEAEITWHEFGPQSLELARRENKPIIFFFHISGCKWCQLMKEKTLKNPAIVKSIEKDFIFIGVDGDQYPTALANFVDEPAYPTLLFAIPSGEVIPFPFVGFVPVPVLQQLLDITTETVKEHQPSPQE